MSESQETLVHELAGLANDVLIADVRSPTRIEFRIDSGAKWIAGKIKWSFEGVAQLDPSKQSVAYWDRIKETSVGFGGSDEGVTRHSYVIRGIERSGGGGGALPSGETYDYDFARVRELVRPLVVKSGWKFKTAFFKPKG